MTEEKKQNVRNVWFSIARRAEQDDFGSTGAQITSDTGLSPDEINYAVEYLVDSDLAEWNRSLDANPFDFANVEITSRGLFELSRPDEEDLGVDSDVGELPPVSPIGSPFGFTDEDWEIVTEQKRQADKLFVVFGFQYKSTHYNSTSLKRYTKNMYKRALDTYNEEPDAPKAYLDFKPLAAGYGGHVFNEIARDIISADIAVFDTSDRNPNVMIEMGVALTWGVRVLPIKKKGTRKPPSDISGQTYADYIDSGKEFVDPDHDRKLLRMVERAIRKKH